MVFWIGVSLPTYSEILAREEFSNACRCLTHLPSPSTLWDTLPQLPTTSSWTPLPEGFLWPWVLLYLHEGRLDMPGLWHPLEQPPTNDWRKLVYKYPSSLASWWENSEVCVFHCIQEFPQQIKPIFPKWQPGNHVLGTVFFFFPVSLPLTLLVFPGITS